MLHSCFIGPFALLLKLNIYTVALRKWLAPPIWKPCVYRLVKVVCNSNGLQNSHCTPRYNCCSGSLSFPPAGSRPEAFSREQWIIESNCLACKTQVEKQLHTCPSLTICTPPPLTPHTAPLTPHTAPLTPHTPQRALVAGDVGQLHQIHSQYRSLWERIRGT